ncbi:MAG TPA: CPBP family intramembrane glutamic endopeptidase [Clostridia bacterium]|nr:CPBP family intramembrane glutamic endopeptidase [Clostridia bacterium]
MDAFRTEGTIAIILYVALSILLIAALLIAGRFNSKAGIFIKKMLPNWKAAGIIALVYFVCFTIGSGFNIIGLVWSMGLFCQAMAAVTLAGDLTNFKAFPVVFSNGAKAHIKSILVMLGFSIITSLIIMVTSAISAGIGQILRETSKTYEAASLIPDNAFKAFFALLAGAGILEGITYRLLILSFILKIVKNKWIAILVSAVIFAFYHFTPLNVMHTVYWQFPVTQFINALLGGTVVGYIYVKRGFETSVLSHTTADWLPLLFFILFR